MKKSMVLVLLFIAAAAAYGQKIPEFQKRKIETKNIVLNGQYTTVNLSLKGEAQLRVIIRGSKSDTKVVYRWRIRGFSGSFFDWEQEEEPYPDADLYSMRRGFLAETWEFHNDRDELWRVTNASVLKNVLYVNWTIYEVIKTPLNPENEKHDEEHIQSEERIRIYERETTHNEWW